MFSRKRIVFILALSVAVSASAVTVATLTQKDTTAAAPMKVKVLRRKDKKQDKPTAAEVAAHKAVNERKLKVKEFKDLPVKIKEVRNLQSDTWYKDLEIEVKNVSGKPIYHIYAHLQFPDVYGDDATRVSGITLEFGLRKYVDIRVVGNSLDPHVKPGDTCVLKIHEQYWRGLRWDQEHIPEKVRRLNLKFAVISFGDETGFAVESPRDYRIKKSRLRHHGKALSSPPQDGCGICSRYIESAVPMQRCWDYSSNQACDSRYASTSPTAPCSRIRPEFFDCDGDGVKECSHDEIYSSPSCPGYSPTPTPSPTPEATPTDEPTPTPTPTPCLNGKFDPNPDGSCPLNSNKINGCCVCQERNTNCERFGQGTLNGQPYCQWNEALCDCYNLEGKCSENPRPSPMPTSTVSAGGGGGGSGGGGENIPPDCTPYWWVLFESYDGGETWHEVSSWYAGCYVN